MDSNDVVDEVNALLKLGVGDSYRLEHIKQAYIQNKTIWVTDENYLKRLREKYLVKQSSDAESDAKIIFENEPEDKEMIHCWKCGKKVPLGANFCMLCGTSLFEIGATPQPIPESKSSKISSKSIPLKIPILVGIPILILIILGAGYTQGYFDNVMESSSSKTLVTPTITDEDVLPVDPDSPCGPGTVLDAETNSCVLGTAKSIDVVDPDSPCGPGTVLDAETNSCVLK